MDKDRDSNITLKGYIYHHEDNCPNPDCQLKKYRAELKAMLDAIRADKNIDV